ncbi:MAG: Holliday junction resolvase RuvX [Flavobacteriales bacterium]
MAFDYGTKRIGIAVTDPLRIIANPLTVVHPDKVYEFINQYLQTEKVEQMLVGLPSHADGSVTHATEGAQNFARSLWNKYKIPVELVDERYSSVYAKDSLMQAGAKRKDRMKKENLDKLSAAIILQWWMEQKQTY